MAWRPPWTARLRGVLAGPLLIAIVTGLVGFLLVSQIRGTQPFRQKLQAEDEGDLTRILASLSTEADSLRDEISALKLQLLTLQTSNQRDSSAAAAADDQLKALEVLSGTVAVTGPGITLTIDDPSGAVAYDTMIDIVQELRDAGAEAIGVNDVRVGVTSNFTERDGKVTLDDAVLNPPFRVDAIGQGATLEGGLKIPGGAIDTLTALRDVHPTVLRTAKLVIPAMATPPAFHAARPVGSSP
ncbi:MAG: DUF881 domain-containing protein [Actinobacteria bacterium]|nr:DUF881 domain-containing protein [Actinomycetota bacterium]